MLGIVSCEGNQGRGHRSRYFDAAGGARQRSSSMGRCSVGDYC
jgi:hypothetical protein